MKTKQLLVGLALSVAMAVTFIPNIAFATDAHGQMVTVEPKAKVIKTDTDLPGQDELLMTYLEKQAAKAAAPKSAAKRSAKRTNLTGNDSVIYNYLADAISEIAAGGQDSSVISIPMAEILGGQIWFTAEDLGVEEITTDGELNSDAQALFESMIEYNDQLIVNTLLKNLPYELYWYDKVRGVGSSTAEFGYNSEGIGFDEDAALTFTFCVSKDYSATGEPGTADLDTTKTGAAIAAAEYAAEIVEENAELSDVEKVTAYKNKICGLTSYNQEAADTNPEYGDPWQLIWVFDNDSETTVVCEGYAKAYQFLCDLSKFQSNLTESRLVYGTMETEDGSEDHMWNIMEMDDNNNYLVDVTNCDEGTIGEDDLLFLKGCCDGAADNGYYFDVDGDDTSDVSYVYNDDMFDLYTPRQLDLSYSDYDPDNVHQHNMDHNEGYEATCENEGLMEYWYCDDCGRYYADEDGTIEIGEEDLTLPIGAHDLEHFEAVEPTVEDSGNKEYWYCNNCNNYFLTKEADVPVDFYDDIYLEPTYDYPWDVPNTPQVEKVHKGSDVELRAEIIDEYDHYYTSDFEYAWYQNPEEPKDYNTGDDYYYLEEVTEPQDWYCDVRLAENPDEVKTIHFKITTLDWYLYVDDSDVYITAEDIGNTVDLTVKVKGLKEDETPVFSWEKYNDSTDEFEPVDCNEATYQAPTEVAEYRVTVTVNGDSDSADFWVRMDSNLQVKGDYEETVLVDQEGDSATLTIEATNDFGDDTIHYNWYKDGYYLEEESGNSITTGPVTENHRYYCYIYDDYGQGTSRYFNVSVQNHFSAEAEQDDIGVEPGEDVSLHVIAEADQEEPLTYQWRVNDELKDSETTDTLTIEDVKSSAYVECVVTDKYGMSQTVNFWIYVDNQLEVEAEQSNFIVESGESVELVVNASAAKGALTYSWQRGTYDAEEDEWNYTELTETGTTLQTGPITEYVKYRCTVDDEYGNSDSVYFYVRPDSGLKLVGEDDWEEVFVAPGETANLSMEVRINDDEPVTYSWRKGWYDEYDDWHSKKIDGADEATFTTEAINKKQEFTCTATDQYGYSVKMTFEVMIDTGLEVDYHQADVLVAPGGTAELHANATANEGVTLSYQWFTGDDDDWEALDGETEDALTVTDIQGYTRYRCRVADDYGNSKNTYIDVRIDNDFKVSTNGSDFYVSPGDDQELIVDATSNEPEKITYTWKQYDEDEDEYVEVQPTDPSKPGIMALTDIQGYQEYRCYVDDGYGYSDYFEFYVYIETGLELDYEGEIVAQAGQDVTLTVTPSSTVENNEYTYEWYDDDDELIEGANKATYTVPNVQQAMDFRCYVTDKYGTKVRAYFEISIDNGFEISYEKEVTIQPGETATLKVTATANEPEGLTYKWYKEEDTLGTDSTLEVSKTGYYRCRVTDKYGNHEWAEIHVIVDNDLELSIDQLEGVSGDSITIQPGDEVTLSATATAKDASGLKYWWYDNEGDKEYDTRSITVSPNRSGSFECTVEDQYGNWVDAYIRVNIASGFSAEADGDTNFVINYGDSVTAKVNATTDEGTLTYGWYVEGDDESEEIVAARDQAECTFVPERTDGFYCWVSDGFNEEYVYFYVQVDTGLKLTYSETVQANENEPVTLEVNATGGAGQLTYQWYEKYVDEDGDVWYDWIDNADKSTYTVKKPENTTYRCRVTDGVDTQYAVIEVVVEACEHTNLTHTDAVAATCTKDGNIEYWYCADCGRYFSDANAETQINKADTVEKAKGHNWGGPTYTWANDYSKVTATRVCENDASHKQTEEATPGAEEISKRSCETKGVTKYTATFKNGAFETQTKTKEEAALGHDWDEGVVTTKPGCETAGVKTFTCKNDATHTKTEPIAAIGHDWDEGKVTTEPGCETAGVKTFTCKNDATHTKTEPIAAIGHDWDEGKVTTEPGCETAGVKTFTCKHDATHTKTESIDPLGHDWNDWEIATPSTCVLEGQEVRTCKHDPSHKEYRKAALLAHQLTHVNGVAATCTEGGVKEYWTCSACGGIFSDAEGKTQITEADLPVAALGHAYGDWVPLDENQHQRVCAHDEDHFENADHIWDAGVVTKEATEAETGVKTFTCSVCGGTKIEVIPMIDKDPITPSDAAADQAKINKKIPKVTATKISTTANIKKKTMTIKFPVSDVVTNYRIQYRITGKSAWNNVWSAGAGKYTIEGLKKYTCCQFRIAGYVKQEDGTWESSEWSVISYRYMNAVTLKKVKAGKAKGSIEVTWTKDSKSIGYQIQYSTKSSMKNAKTITIDKNGKTKYTIKKLKSGKKYYIKVRPIATKSNKKHLGALSKRLAVKAK